MSTNDTARNKSRATTDVQKRAEWEAFEFSVPERGRVRVENHSHEDPSEHTYDVDVEHGSAVACTCPADEYNETCKHRVATESNAPVLAAASGVVEADDDRNRPRRSEPADFGGGESTGVVDLLGGEDA